MTQFQILSGIYTDNGPDIKISYPVNLSPYSTNSGISSGYLRPAEGIDSFSSGPGRDRGGIEWNGTCYRVMGSKLVSVSNTGIVTILGDVGDNQLPVTLDYSFDRLAIASNGSLFYYNTVTGLVQVTDSDLGTVIDVVWVDGYFMTTDGTALVVTELNDPTSVNPLKYGSSEIDPDSVVAVLKARNEIYAINRHTIEVFDNVGGDLFPFSRVRGAQISRGAIGTHACTVFSDAIAFVGSGRNESVAVYIGANSGAQKISTEEIDKLLNSYSEAELTKVVVESKNHTNHQCLYIHLPDRTAVYDITATLELKIPIWYILTSSQVGFSTYRARFFTWCYDSWICGDTISSGIGKLVNTHGNHWDTVVRWEFGTIMLYSDSKGVIFNSLELVSLAGRISNAVSPRIATSYSNDGISWSQPRSIQTGTIGDRTKRLVWLRNGMMRNWRIQRFTGDSTAHLSFIRLEAQLEPLSN